MKKLILAIFLLRLAFQVNAQQYATTGSNTFTGTQTFNGSIKGNSTGGALRIQTTNGYLDIGSMNTTGTHLYTDKDRFYFNKPIYLLDGKLSAYTTNNLYLQTNGTNRMTILSSNGNIGIGIETPTNKLEVNGTIRAKEVKIENTNWPDFVFSPDYQLPSLETVSNHIEKHKHLPNIPSVTEVEANGVSVGEMQAKLLQKIEELTLYVIEQNKSIQDLQKANTELKDEVTKLKNNK